MSRGLGKLQRAILEALQANETTFGTQRYSDIRETVAHQLGGYGRYGLTSAFEAAFARAVRTLSDRGLVRHLPYMDFLARVADVPDKR